MLALEAAKGIREDPLAALSEATDPRTSRAAFQVTNGEVGSDGADKGAPASTHRSLDGLTPDWALSEHWASVPSLP